MSTQLKFNVRNQHVSRADHFYVVEKSQNYLRADFDFLTDDWAGLQKIAVFTRDGVSYKIILDSDGSCLVPWEHLGSTGTIDVSVYGVGGGDEIIIETANRASVMVYVSGYSEDAENEGEPTPTVWEQIVSKLENVDGGTYEDWKTDEAPEGGE